ncbi:MAG: sulfotransferase family protein [Actinobacteria bacterium]|nr:sulfotransferase family protein [Actinomycetota bacterium]
MKVIGVGFGRTGTMSLKAALERLGAGPCFHMIDLIVGEERDHLIPKWVEVADGTADWHDVFDGYEATVDWPAAARWREICDAFPDAPVLLNVREFDGWYRSMENTIRAAKVTPPEQLEQDANRPPPNPTLWGVIDRLIWEGDFQGRFEDKAWVREMYDARIAEIKATIAPDRLTVWELGVDGWEPLAAMLDVAVPDEPFPRLHDTAEFRSEFGLPALA